MTQNGAVPKTADQSWQEYLGTVGAILDVLEKTVDNYSLIKKALLIACRWISDVYDYPHPEAMEAGDTTRSITIRWFDFFVRTAQDNVVCRECGYIENYGWNDGCFWVESDLCSSCADAEYEDFEDYKDIDDEYDALMEDMRYLADHTSPCGICMYEGTDNCTGAENSTCFKRRGS